MNDSSDRHGGCFDGLHTRLGSNRLYRVYVGDSMLAGAYLAGEIYDEQAAARAAGSAGFLLRGFIRRRLEERRAREHAYESMDPFSPAFLDQDARNFQISRSEVMRTCLRKKSSMTVASSPGVIEIETIDRRRRRLVLLGGQDPEQVAALMRPFDPNIEVTGTFVPKKPKPTSPRQRRIFYWGLAVVFILYAVAFTAGAMAGIVDKWLLLILVGMNIYVARRAIGFASRDPKNVDDDQSSSEP